MERQQMTAQMLIDWIMQFFPLDQPIVVLEEPDGSGALEIVRVVFDSKRKRFVIVVNTDGT